MTYHRLFLPAHAARATGGAPSAARRAGRSR